MKRGRSGGEGASERSTWLSAEEEAATGRIIAAAITVHRELGPGFIESVYHRALAHELDRRGIAFTSEVDISVRYDGVLVGRHRLDIVADEGIVLELKAVHALDAVHFAQLRSYLKASGWPIGLLLNFAASRLVIKRVIVRRPAFAVGSGLPFLPNFPRDSDRPAESSPISA